MATRGTKKQRPRGRYGPVQSAAPSDAAHVNVLFQRIYKVVRSIPRGKVATYGQVAELAGLPRAARVAGAAMRASDESMGLPWHRVIGKKSRTTGKVSILDPIGGAVQQKLLEAEGVTLTTSGSISLVQYGWLPLDD